MFAGYVVPEKQFDLVNSECEKIKSLYFDREKPHLRVSHKIILATDSFPDYTRGHD